MLPSEYSRVPSKHFCQFGLSVWPAIVNITYLDIYINYSWLIGPGVTKAKKMLSLFSQFEISIKIFFFSSCFKLFITYRYKKERIGPWTWILPIVLCTIACGFSVLANLYPKIDMYRSIYFKIDMYRSIYPNIDMYRSIYPKIDMYRWIYPKKYMNCFFQDL